MHGHALATTGSNPSDGLEQSYSGQYLAFPRVANLHFGLDGTLWNVRDVDDVEQVGTREDSASN